MSTLFRYQLPLKDTHWTIEGRTETTFTWEYEDGNEKLLQLYSKGKKQQWDAATRIDWSLQLDPENPQGLDDRLIPIYGSELWRRLSPEDIINVRRHHQAMVISQLMHGEQGALLAASRLVQMMPDRASKFYAATQVADEARHVEAYARLLNEKLGLAYPITPSLRRLLESTLTDSRWDMVFLGMQVLIEGLALAAFSRYRDFSKNRLAASVNAYVMQDEARHVAFGRLALREHYPQLSSSEKAEREQFVLEAVRIMRDQFTYPELWQNLGFSAQEAVAAAEASESMRVFRTRVFSRIIPVVKDIGLWSPAIQKLFGEMGALEFANVDIAEQLEADHRIAEEFDAGRFVKESLEASPPRLGERAAD